MAGHQFEDYHARLPASPGMAGVIGRKPGGDGGTGILATDSRAPLRHPVQELPAQQSSRHQ